MAQTDTNALMPAVFQYKLIYIFRINDEAHQGLLKIGDATIESSLAPDLIPQEKLFEAARKRISQYTKTAMAKAECLHAEIAIRKNREGQLVSFRDYAVHEVLFRTSRDYHYDDKGGAREWFRVDLQTARNAIAAVKQNRSSLNADETTDVWNPIILREEQNEAIKVTEKHFHNRKNSIFLWNAKMRFGKTVTALEFIRQSKLDIKHTIIITQRPAVKAGWYEDFHKVFSHENLGYQFGTRDNVRVGTPWSELHKSESPFIYFTSLQDLRNSAEVGGKYNKNDDVFGTRWDLVIVDEAHEGTKTILGEKVIQMLLHSNDPAHRTLLLALSGTPFNIAEDFDDMRFTWDYVQEQKRKQEYAALGISNPYEDLPAMRMMTFNLADEIKGYKQYQQFQDKAFNFAEFFRVGEDGFIHKDDVKRFLDLLCQPGKAGYPFTSDEYRKMFRHTLWVVPGVKEAKELQKMLESHAVFGSFKVCNVAGEGNIENDDALKTVKDAIAGVTDPTTGESGYTITLTCGKLTTGVTVPEWTAVLYLAGTISTSVQSYMQTIFRVQSPCNAYGMSKQYCYVFDFAPDRSLKLVSDAIALGARKPGKTTTVGKKIIGDFLNFCPIISVDAAQMTEYNVDRMMRQLKRAYAENAVHKGFGDNCIYKAEFNLDEVDKELFKQLHGIVGSSKDNSSDEVTISDVGLTNEEHDITEQPLEAKDGLANKKAKTEEEQKRAEAKAERQKAISILKSVSIRIPLLIYGAVVGNGNGDDDFNNDVTLDWLLTNIDDTSWNEFMPKGVTKDLFRQFTKYYDEDIFVEAGRQIRQKVKDADMLPPLLRVQKIVELLACFKNPDKETVLTPWRVVNMHLSDTLGGYDWFDEKHTDIKCDDDGNPVLRWIDQGQVTKDTWDNPNAKILEINSKSGVYPLYATFSLWARRCYDEFAEQRESADSATLKRILSLNDILKLIDAGRQKSLWQEVVEENIFVVCMTPMAKAITKRTLLGFENSNYNAEYIENLVSKMKEDTRKVAKDILRKSFWHLGDGAMEFDAVIGNPPYMLKTSGESKNQAVPIYPYFCYTAVDLQSQYVSVIMPSKWFAGGMTALDEFRDRMMTDSSIKLFKDFTNSKDCFPTASIAGGVGYYLRDSKYVGPCSFTNITNGNSTTVVRHLDEFPVVVRHKIDCNIIHKVNTKGNFVSLQDSISPLDPFGIPSKYRGYEQRTDDSMLKLFTSGGCSYIKRELLPVGSDGSPKGYDYIDCYKVMSSILIAEHAGEPDKNGQVAVITKTVRVLCPGEICNFSYFIIGKYKTLTEANNVLSYIKTRFVRSLINLCISSIHLSRKVFAFVPLQDFTSSSDIDWSKSIPEIDQQLYKKYGLTDDEIHHIEDTIKPMN